MRTPLPRLDPHYTADVVEDSVQERVARAGKKLRVTRPGRRNIQIASRYVRTRRNQTDLYFDCTRYITL